MIYLSVQETIDTCGISRSTLYRYTNEGLEYIMHEGHRYFSEDAVMDYIRENKGRKRVHIPKRIDI